MPGEFSVAQFFQDDTYEYVRRYVDAKSAMEAVRHYTDSVDARLGMVKRVIITDGGDCTCFEWTYGKGMTFPTPEQVKESLASKQPKAKA